MYDYILLCCPTNIAASNYGPCMEMKHMYTRDHPRLRLLTKHLQHESTFYNIRLIQIKYLEHMFATYVSSHCNICNIQIKALATYVWSKWNILNRYLQYMCITISTYATSRSTFATSISRIEGPPSPAGTAYAYSWNTCNMKELSTTYVWSRWNIWNIRLQHTCIATVTYVISTATYATFR
jgi:hypothetical protein